LTLDIKFRFAFRDASDEIINAGTPKELSTLFHIEFTYAN
jgi:hypothetical protein